MVYSKSEAHLTNFTHHVTQGMHIITDGWGAYRNLSTAGYIHTVVIHGQNIVAPDDAETHKQRIKTTWLELKRFIKSRGTNKGQCYLEYVCDYLFRRRHEDIFDSLLNTIRAKYPFARD
jgi:hypothetical protein